LYCDDTEHIVNTCCILYTKLHKHVMSSLYVLQKEKVDIEQ